MGDHLARSDARVARWGRSSQLRAAWIAFLISSSFACGSSDNAPLDTGVSTDVADGARDDAGPGQSGDGSANAPNCTIQYPTLLNSYAHTPSWQVAGVHYCVGYPASTTLKDPAGLAIAGVSVNAGNKTVTVTGNNVVLDGYDFSLSGGWGVVVNGANDTIRNSKFVVGANGRAPILAGFSGSNLYVGYSVIDGSGSAAVGGLIEYRGNSALTVEYCWLKNAGIDVIQLHTNGAAAAPVIRYNVVENAGLTPGAHGDYTEFLDGPYSATIVYNTTLQNGGTTQGFMVEPDIGSNAGTVVSAEIGHNTFTSSGGLSYFTAVTSADVQDTFLVDENYFDARNAFGFAIGAGRGGPGDAFPRTIYTHNVNMVDGNLVQD